MFSGFLFVVRCCCLWIESKNYNKKQTTNIIPNNKKHLFCFWILFVCSCSLYPLMVITIFVSLLFSLMKIFFFFVSFVTNLFIYLLFDKTKFQDFKLIKWKKKTKMKWLIIPPDFSTPHKKLLHPWYKTSGKDTTLFNHWKS